ncbi:MAG: phage BR0599 family protein [Verrucomicrobiota bacterium]
MTYLTRQVFDYPIDWAVIPVSRIDYDLREIDLGFGAEAYWSDQVHVVRGWRFSFHLDDADSIAQFDDWIEALNGRLVGFWLPTPEAAFEIVAGVDASSFKIRSQGLTETWTEQPELHVCFQKEGETIQCGKVIGVADNGDGTETVTLESALAVPVDATWQAKVLAYVRLADDVERGQFDAEGRMTRQLSVVELPLEYASFETGTKPVYLYHFYTLDGGSQTDWRYTSFGWDIANAETTWTSKRITHKQLHQSTRGDRQELEIEAEFEPENPLYQLCPCAMAMALYVEVVKADYSDLGNQTVLFQGRVLSVDVKGRIATAKCASFLDAFGAAVPHFFLQPRCNFRVFEPNTCRIAQSAFEHAGSVVSVDGTSVVVSGQTIGGLPANWFAEGLFQSGTGPEFEQRTILASTAESGGSITLTLNHRLFYTSQGADCVVVPGCDGRPETCSGKFANFVNFGGHRYALKNLTLKALEIPQTDTAKK